MEKTKYRTCLCLICFFAAVFITVGIAILNITVYAEPGDLVFSCDFESGMTVDNDTKQYVSDNYGATNDVVSPYAGTGYAGITVEEKKLISGGFSYELYSEIEWARIALVNFSNKNAEGTYTISFLYKFLEYNDDTVGVFADSSYMRRVTFTPTGTCGDNWTNDGSIVTCFSDCGNGVYKVVAYVQNAWGGSDGAYFSFYGGNKIDYVIDNIEIYSGDLRNSLINSKIATEDFEKDSSIFTLSNNASRTNDKSISGNGSLKITGSSFWEKHASYILTQDDVKENKCYTVSFTYKWIKGSQGSYGFIAGLNSNNLGVRLGFDDNGLNKDGCWDYYPERVYNNAVVDKISDDTFKVVVYFPENVDGSLPEFYFSYSNTNETEQTDIEFLIDDFSLYGGDARALLSRKKSVENVSLYGESVAYENFENITVTLPYNAYNNDNKCEIVENYAIDGNKSLKVSGINNQNIDFVMAKVGAGNFFNRKTYCSVKFAIKIYEIKELQIIPCDNATYMTVFAFDFENCCVSSNNMADNVNCVYDEANDCYYISFGFYVRTTDGYYDLWKALGNSTDAYFIIDDVEYILYSENLTAYRENLNKVDEGFAENRLIKTIGAQTRIFEPSGLRFGFEINSNLLSELEQNYGNENVSYGAVIIPNRLKDGRLTVDTDSALNKTIENYSESDGQKIIFATLIGIPKDYYDLDISARAYVKVINGNEVVYYYSDEKVCSIASIAKIALENSLSDSESDVYKYKVTVNGETKYSFYNEYQFGILSEFSKIGE